MNNRYSLTILWVLCKVRSCRLSETNRSEYHNSHNAIDDVFDGMPYQQLGVISSREALDSLVQLLIKLDFQIKAIWAKDTDCALATATANGIPCVASSPDEVLLRKDVQMVVVSCHPAIQANIAVKSLGIGKHVLCTVPVAVTQPEVHKLVLSASYYPQILSLAAFQLRTLRVVTALRKAVLVDKYVGRVCAVQANVFSPPLFDRAKFDWLWDSSSGGGVLNLIGSHVIDLIAHVTGLRAVKVYGHTATFDDTNPTKTADGGGGGGKKTAFRKLYADNYASFCMQMADQVMAQVTLNAINARPGGYEHEIKLTGTEGCLVATNNRLIGEKAGKTEVLATEDELTDDTKTLLSVPAAPIFDRGLLRLLQTLADTVKNYDTDLDHSGNAWQQSMPALAQLASFEDAQYVQTVISAVRQAALSDRAQVIDASAGRVLG